MANSSPNAFPTRAKDAYYPGMSLRDWFAGQALVGYLAATKPPRGFTQQVLANECYAQADAMLKAREAK